VKVANAASGMHFFQVSKVGTQYRFYVDEVQKDFRAASDIDVCWSGVQQVEWQNEMLNQGDQAGGTLSNHQKWAEVQYQDASGWHYETRPPLTTCDANSIPAYWHCGWSNTPAQYFNAWDNRVP
jgi:hypothetical protein